MHQFNFCVIMLPQVYFGSTDWEKWTPRSHRLHIRYKTISVTCRCLDLTEEYWQSNFLRENIFGSLLLPKWIFLSIKREFNQTKLKFDTWNTDFQLMEKTIIALSLPWSTCCRVAFGTSLNTLFNNWSGMILLWHFKSY